MLEIRIDIFLANKLHASWRSPTVPRIGEHIWIPNVDALPRGSPDIHAGWCKIEDVRWVGDGQGGLYLVELHVNKISEEISETLEPL